MRIVSEEQIAQHLARVSVAEPRIVTSGNVATPGPLVSLVDSSLGCYRLFILNAQHRLPVRDGVVYETPFVGPGMRHEGSRLDYLPTRLSLVPQLFYRSRPPDVVLLHTSTVQQGKVSLGIEVNILPAAIEQTRARGGLIIAQLNPHMPYTLGDSEVDVDLIDLAVEIEQPLPSPIPASTDGIAEEIGLRVADMVSDGSCLQAGIGKIPNATLAALAPRRGLAVWSEMLSDGVLSLERCGATDKARPLVASFLFGSKELYGWVDHNPRIRMMRTETTNDPGMIARQPLMMSINTALQVDLFAQANASFVGGNIYSGFGGQTDFIVGALHSWGGHAVIALPSWHEKSDSSTVVGCLSGPVTSFQHSAIMTEQGCAEIFGRSQRAQARLMIENIAHPKARPGLWESATHLGLLKEGLSNQMPQPLG